MLRESGIFCRLNRTKKILHFFSLILVLVAWSSGASAAGYTCPTLKKYTTCATNYYMVRTQTSTTHYGTPVAGNRCIACSNAGTGCTCSGGTAAPSCGVTCPAGKYLPANKSSASDCATCENGYYCPGGTFTKNSSSVQGRNSCPTATSTTAAASSSYPDVFYPYTSTSGSVNKGTVPTYNAFNKQSWGTGWSAITECKASYSFNGTGGGFNADNVRYNSTSNKYDNFSGADIYYSSAKAGYYLYTKYSDTYCNTGTNRMLYRKAVVCPAGYYCPGGSVPQCSTGTHNNEWGRTICPAGKYCTAGVSAGTNCPAGTYRSSTGGTAASSCTRCVGNATTSSTGQTSVSACICKAGYGGNAASTSGSCTACTTGHFKQSNGNTSCSTASVGYYVSTLAATSQSACTSWRANTTTTGTGSTSTSACVCKGGYRLNSTTCTACATGTYKSSASNATSCTAASVGYYVSTTAATSQSACTSWRANTTTTGTGSTSTSACVCKGGYRLNSTTCTACATGTYKSSASNATSCTAAGVGYYVSTTGATSQSACTSWRANTTTTGTGSTSTSSCLCKAGYLLNGSTCSACGTGTYKSAISNATSCTAASVGYYVSTTAATSQSACTSWRANTTTTGTGSTSTSACVCKVGYGWNGSACASCAGGTYKTTTANTACSSCGSGYYCTGGSHRAACSSLTAPAVTGGTYSSVSPYNAASTCRYKAPTAALPTYCATKTSNTISYSGTAWGTNIYSVTAKSGSIISGNNTKNATCTQCSGAVWSAGGTATACSSCPPQTSGWTRATGTGWGSVGSCYQTRAATAVSTYCSAGQLKQTGKSTTEWNASTISVAFQAKAGSIVSGQTCTQCSGAVWSAGGTATSCSSCPAQTSGWTRATGTGWGSVTQCNQTKSVGGNCSAGVLRQNATSTTAWGGSTISTALQAKPGYIVSGQTCTGCSAGTYSAGGTATSCSACTTRAKYSGANASACTNVSSGYYTTGCNTSGNNCTGQSQCTGTTYCVSGVKNNCPAAESNWTLGTGNGWSAVTSCFETRNATSVSSYCSAGQLKKNATSSGTWPTASTISVAFQAKAGSIVSGQTCTQCSGAVWSAGGTATACSSCPAQTSGWTRATGTGWGSVGSCYQTRAATAVSTYCSAGQLKQTGKSTTEWNASTISVAFQAKAGSIVSGQTCTQCSGAVWSAGGTATSCSSCPANYGANTATGKTAASQCQTSCAAGYAVQEANKACAIVPSGYQTGTHKVNYGSTTPKAADSTSPAVGTWYSCLTNYSATGSAATNHDARSDCKINCGAGTRIASANATSCTTPSGNWWIGAHTVAAGSASSVSNCNSGYSISGTAATDHDAAADCKISCGGGYYIPTANATSCSSVGVGYWAGASVVSQGNVGSRTACASGLTTIGYGAGADEAGDCGRVMHFGDSKLYLRSTKKTTPSLNVKIGDKTFYGNMSTATKGKLRIKKDATTYSVHDDSM